MSNDDQRPLFNRPAANLLDELESIRGSLTEGFDDETAADIPLLDDMVIHNLNSNAHLLDLKQIFEDQFAEENHAEKSNPAANIVEPSVQFPRFTLDVAISDDLEITQEPDLPSDVPTQLAPVQSVQPQLVQPPPIQPQRQRMRPDYSREVLIQELIDEFMPRIEAELHARLGQLDDALLRRLKDSK